MSKNKDVSIRVLGNKGQELNSKMFNQEIKKSDLDDPNQIEIFNKYNKNGDDKLDADEMQNLFSDLQTSAQNIDTTKDTKQIKRGKILNTDCDRIFDKIDNADGKEDSVLTNSQVKEFYSKIQTKNKTLEPFEIQKLLKSKGLSKKVKVGDVLNFLDKLEVNANVKNLGDFKLNNKAKKELNSIQTQNVADVLTSYKKSNGESIIQHIANRSWALGSKRNDYINIVKNKLIEQAQLNGIDTKDFKKDFDAELKKLDLTLFSKGDTSKLDSLADDLVKKIKSKQDVYKANRGSIASIMANPNECRTDDDKYDLINKIIEYSNQNNPQRTLKNIIATTKDPKIKHDAKMLLNSKMITDYFPTYVASIIAQESQFRGKDDAVYKNNGQGMMQLTKRGIEDIYVNPENYNSAFVKEITSKYPTANILFNKIQKERNTDLNIKVGTEVISGHIRTILRQISQNKLPKNINTDTPEVIMEFVARSYNGYKAAKQDPKYNNNISTVKNIYGRDVIQRFHEHAPKDANVKKYFEYNPTSKQYINRNFSN